MTKDVGLAPEKRPARVHHRVSAVWLIPLVAALAVGWLRWQTLSARGPSITITFASAEGLEAGKTKIKHNDVELGLIESLAPTSDLAHVVATARMSKFAESHLAEGTRFWIVRPRFSVEGISGLSTLVSGAYVELDPGQGSVTHRFTALDEPPVINANEPGSRIHCMPRDLVRSLRATLSTTAGSKLVRSWVTTYQMRMAV
jgi:paraquat-inducible protein B